MGSTRGAFGQRFGPAWRSLRARASSPFGASNRIATFAALALLIGFGLRVWSIRQARFSGEESWFWSIGRDIATGQAFPALGHPITGSSARHPGAAFFWLLGMTQLLGPSPLAAYAAVSLGGWVALGLLFPAVARPFDGATGLAFPLLASVSPS